MDLHSTARGFFWLLCASVVLGALAAFEKCSCDSRLITSPTATVSLAAAGPGIVAFEGGDTARLTGVGFLSCGDVGSAVRVQVGGQVVVGTIRTAPSTRTMMAASTPSRTSSLNSQTRPPCRLT